MSPLYLGIDLGTTAIKALLADEDGRAAASAEMPLSGCYAGTCRLDMNGIRSVTAELLTRFRQQNRPAWQRLKGVCIAGQGDGLFPLDEAGRPFLHAFTWQDTRAYKEAAAINAAANAIEGGFFNPAFAGSRLALLLWLKEHQPEQYKATARALTATSYLLYSFTGEYAEDESNCAETFDLRLQTRSEHLFSCCGMQDAVEKYPRVLPADAIAGHVTKEAAEYFGLPFGIPVAVGCLDATACALGAGDAFEAQMILGTTAAVSVYLPGMPEPGDSGAFIDRVPFSPPRWRETLATSSGASAIDYGRRLLFPDADYETLYRIAQRVPPGAQGVLFLPFLYGERAPFACEAENGAFLGLGPRHGREHMLRACIEGVACSARNCFAHLPRYPACAAVSGGAARSAVFCQILADVLRMELTRTPPNDGARGCVRLICRALGKNQTWREEDNAVFFPTENGRDEYERQYRRYCESIDLLWNSQNKGKT